MAGTRFMSTSEKKDDYITGQSGKWYQFEREYKDRLKRYVNMKRSLHSRPEWYPVLVSSSSSSCCAVVVEYIGN